MFYQRLTTLVSLIFCLGVIWSGCSTEQSENVSDVDQDVNLPEKVMVTSGMLEASFDPENGLIISYDGDSVLSFNQTGGPGRIKVASAEHSSRMTMGSFKFTELSREISSASEIAYTRQGADGAEFGITVGDQTLEGRLVPLEDNAIQVQLTFPDNSVNRLSVSFNCSESDSFMGFGAQSNAIDQRGRRFSIWLSEPGVGKLEEGDSSALFGVTGTPNSCAFPLPYFINTAGYGLALKATEYTTFDLCSSEPEVFVIETWSNQLSMVIMGGTPEKIVERYTSDNGRQKIPAPWVFAPWNDAIHGHEEVLRIARLLREHNIPSSVIWTEDWVGGRWNVGGYHLHYHWEPDLELYPDLPALSDELHQMGFRFLAYFNPFVAKQYPEWEEAVSGGFLMTRTDGEVYEFVSPMGDSASLVDVTKPEGVEWLHSYLSKAEELGFDGWMSDFGEWVPFDGVFGLGSGATLHNQYPLFWQRAHRSFWEERRPDGDFAFFSRSGFTGSPGLVDVMWAGDQNTDWKPDDGMPSVIPMALNVGFAGISTFGHDIAGYTSFISPPSTKELFFRWVELGAWSPIMRTHHGTADNENWNFATDEETIAHYKHYAIEHMQLFPYFYALAKVAQDKGLPITRHPVLHFPEDGEILQVVYEYMLGPYIYVAPVLVEGARTRTLYLPSGIWIMYPSGQRITGGTSVTVDCELGEIPVFIREGAIIPRLPRNVETLVACDECVGVSGNPEQLLVDLYMGGSSEFVLEDRTLMELTSQEERPIAYFLDGERLELCDDDRVEDCLLEFGAGINRILVNREIFMLTGEVESGDVVFEFSLSSSISRESYIITLWI